MLIVIISAPHQECSVFIVNGLSPLPPNHPCHLFFYKTFRMFVCNNSLYAQVVIGMFCKYWYLEFEQYLQNLVHKFTCNFEIRNDIFITLTYSRFQYLCKPQLCSSFLAGFEAIFIITSLHTIKVCMCKQFASHCGLLSTNDDGYPIC